MEVALSEEESSALNRALRTYLMELRSEISDTDNREFRDRLKHERGVLEDVVGKLDAMSGSSELRDTGGREVVRVVSLWWSETADP